MMQLSSFGSPFKHTYSSCLNIKPKNFEWIHNSPSSSDIEVYIDEDGNEAENQDDIEARNPFQYS